MDSRIALQKNTILTLRNKDGGLLRFTITKELGRGGTCIVYEAFLVSKTKDKKYYRIKECYPYKLNIERTEDCTLKASEDDLKVFAKTKQDFEKDFSVTSKLFYVDKMFSYMPDQLDLFDCNNTKYIVSTYSAEYTLATYKPKDIKECINIVKKVAYVLENIHKHGYLFLDTKPSNILVINDLEKQIKLLDFDSLVSFNDIARAIDDVNYHLRLSFSKGFAPVELESAMIKRLGPHTDVFSVGALLFWLLFERSPLATDCETDAIYDFTKISYSSDEYASNLFRKLTDFFHNTLSSFYLDRFQSMDDVFFELEKLENLADISIPRIVSSFIFKPKYVFGRQKELEQLESVLLNDKSKSLFITGMAGIGKSTLVREFLAKHKDCFDVILYVDYFENMEKTISDDSNINITNLCGEDYKNNKPRYFDIKLRKMKDLVKDVRAILVVDNFYGEVDNDILSVMQLDCNVIFVGRQLKESNTYEVLNIDVIDDQTSLIKIFERNFGSHIKERDIKQVNQLISLVSRHTLLIELMAKQIARSHLTLKRAIEIAQNSGIGNMGKEKINFEKDGQSFNKTLIAILNDLLDLSLLSDIDISVLKIVSLTGLSGINIHVLKKVFDFTTFDNVNSLIDNGWLTLNDSFIFMHPIIQESIRAWKWDSLSLEYACFLQDYFCKHIWFESQKNNITKAYLDKHPELDDKDLSLPCDRKVLMHLLNTGEAIVENYKKDNGLNGKRDFSNLYCAVVLFIPQYREKYIFDGCVRLIDSGNLDNPQLIMRLYSKMLELSLSKKDFETSLQILKDVASYLKEKDNNYLRAMYFNMLSEYYDFCLDGAYDATTGDEKEKLRNLLSSINKTIHYSKKYADVDIDHLYTNNLLSKATILIRSGCARPKKILSLIKKAEADIDKNTFMYADVIPVFYLVLAWYACIILADIKLADTAIKKTIDFSQTIMSSEIDFIEGVIVPCANIYFEFGEYQKSLGLLNKGIQICAKHKNIDAYDRLTKDLQKYYDEVLSEINVA